MTGQFNAAQGHYAAAWFDWCEFCGKWRIRIFWWVEDDGTIGDTVETVSPGPYLEVFARRRRPGWDAWGDEIESDVELLVA